MPQVRALPDPRFTYRYYIREVETRVGAQRQSFALAQKFPWFGKLALRGDAAARAADAARRRYEGAKLKLFYQVKNAYYEYFHLGRAIAITDQNVKLVKHIESVARTRFKTAAGNHPDVIRAQVELGKLDDRLRALKDLRGPIVARLNAALNRPPDAPLPWPRDFAAPAADLADARVLGRLTRTNPELLALDDRTAQRKVQIDLARKNYFPDVTVGVTHIDTARSTGGRHPGGDGDDPVIAMVSVNLPIWWDKLSAGVREARHRHRAARCTRRDRANTLQAETKMVLYRYRDAGRKIDLYRDTLLPKGRQAVRATEATYRAGTGSFVDLIDAQRVLLAFELSYERAHADRAQRLAELEMLVGEELLPAGTPGGQRAVTKVKAGAGSGR